MKPLIWIITLTTAALSLPRTSCAQQPTPAAGSAVVNQAKALDERARSLEAKAKASDERKAADEQEEKSSEDIDTIPTPPPTPRGKHWSTGGGFAGAGVAPLAMPFSQNRLQPIIGHAAGGPGKPVVIRSSNADPKEEGNLEEDLAVMAHILDKSLDDLPAGHSHGFKAAGIDVFFTPGQTPMRCFYLDGYGAVFLLNVGFPLVPPRQKADQEKPVVDSAWAEAQEELFGQPSQSRFVTGMAEEYSEEKVNKLKDSLFETLKNASNIRGLKPDDSITVCVFGGSSTSRSKAKPGAKRAVVSREGDTLLWQDGEGQARQTMLTVRVKKTDVDAYAKGKLSPEEFQKRAKLTAYNSGAGAGALGGSFGYGFGYGGAVGETLR